MRKRRILAVVAAVAAVCVMAGCGGKKGDFDVAALGNDLNTKITYADTLAPMDIEVPAERPRR